MSHEILSQANSSFGRVSVAPAPVGAPISADYHIEVMGVGCPVYVATDGSSHYSYFDMSGGPVVVKVTSTSAGFWDAGAQVVPASKGIQVTRDGNTVSFTITTPGQYSLERIGVDYRPETIPACIIAANPPEVAVPQVGDPQVVYFGPGFYDVPSITVMGGQTLYLAPGAYVRTNGIVSVGTAIGQGIVNQSDLRILGRGILDIIVPAAWKCPIVFQECSRLTLDGITIFNTDTREFNGFCIYFRNTDHIAINNVKFLGHTQNSDGPHFEGSSHVVIKNCLVRTIDDCISIYGDAWRTRTESSDYVIENCVMWPIDSGVARIGTFDYKTPVHARNIVFRNIDVLHTNDHEHPCALVCMRNYKNQTYQDILFEDIRMEDHLRRFVNLDGTDLELKGLMFKDISYPDVPTEGAIINIANFDRIVFQNITVGGKLVRKPADIGMILSQATQESTTGTIEFRDAQGALVGSGRGENPEARH